MSDFRKLIAPKETTRYQHKGWYVAAEPQSAWLATTGEVTSSRENMAILFFDTELEAYEASKTYYSRHTMYYPHELVLNVLRYGGGGTAKVVTNESKAMEFE